MSVTLLPLDGSDLSLLMEAAVKASSTSLRQLDAVALSAMARDFGLDFATAVLYERTKREHSHTSQEIDRFYRNGSPDIRLEDVAFAYIPNLAYFADPKSQAVGAAICRAAEKFGCRTIVVPTSATQSLRVNARIVCDSLAQCTERSIIVASVSKGSADVKMAIRESDDLGAFQKVTAWLDVCGLTKGSPLVNALTADSDGRLQRVVERWFRVRGLPLVRDVLEASRELGYGAGYPLHEPMTVPAHISRLNVVGFPATRHFSFKGVLGFHNAIAQFGPNDGYGLLRDMVTAEGDVYPIWGTDHYFEARLDVERLAAALLAYLVQRGATIKADGAAPWPTVRASQRVREASHTSQEPLSTSIPHGARRDGNDWERLRHARERHEGFHVGRYLQPAPMIFSRDGHNLFLGDMYRGRSAFLLGGGPSLTTHDLSLLNQRGIVTCAMNNAAAVFRPQLWVSIDDPGHFVDAIWRDAGILKFVPLCHMEKHFIVRDRDGGFVPSDEVVGDMPTVFGYRRNEHFKPEQWLFEDTFNWGNHSKTLDADGNKGSRSVMYVAIRLMFYLGIRRLYLAGCDFKMDHGAHNYAFLQDRSAQSVRGNNESYHILNQRLSRLVPYFEREGFEIFNCTPDSGLTAFPHMPFDLAVQEASSEIPDRIDTSGMYDRQQNERDRKRATKSERRAAVTPATAIQSRPRANDFPEMTLVTAVTRAQLKRLALTAPTWFRHKPELLKLPFLVIHDESTGPGDSVFDSLREHPNLRFIEWTQRTTQSMQAALIALPGCEVETPWYLALDPDVVACHSKDWRCPDWFSPDDQGREPVFIGHRWSYSKPADAIDRLDQWADLVPGLSARPGLQLHRDPHSDRVQHPRIVSWCYFGATAWAREIAPYATNDPPCATHGMFVSYCAARRGDHFVRADMRRFGWEYISGNERQIQRRCTELLAAQ